jgi:riboflavin synthase
MFTGIIESLGNVIDITHEGTNQTFTLECDFTNELKVDQSLAHNGICLTVTDIRNNAYKVTAIAETLKRTNLGDLTIGSKVNLERCMLPTGRLDGHIVQGHVDETAIISTIKDENGSWSISFEYNKESAHYTVEKGSVCINGVSLTVVDSSIGKFSVAIIPYTWEHTNFHTLKVGDTVNVEFDIIGKYVTAYMKNIRQ